MPARAVITPRASELKTSPEAAYLKTARRASGTKSIQLCTVVEDDTEDYPYTTYTFLDLVFNAICNSIDWDAGDMTWSTKIPGQGYDWHWSDVLAGEYLWQDYLYAFRMVTDGVYPAAIFKAQITGPCWGTLAQYAPVAYSGDYDGFWDTANFFQNAIHPDPIGATFPFTPVSLDSVTLGAGESLILYATGTPSESGGVLQVPGACFRFNKTPDDFA